MDEPLKKMVEVWIEQHSLKITRAYIIEVRMSYSGMINYHQGNYNVVISTDGDDILQGCKSALKLYKRHLKELKNACA